MEKCKVQIKLASATAQLNDIRGAVNYLQMQLHFLRCDQLDGKVDDAELLRVCGAIKDLCEFVNQED